MMTFRIQAMSRRILVSLACMILGGALTGCTLQPPLPKFPWVDSNVAMRTMTDRLQAVQSVSAQADLVLSRKQVGSIHFDGALAMRLPGKLRLRAWKFGQAVFDLTLTPKGLWLESPLDPSKRDKLMSAAAEAGPYANSWGLFFGNFFSGGDPVIVDHGGSTFIVQRKVSLAPNTPPDFMTCEVDRETLTPRKYVLYGENNKPRFTLLVERYREYPAGLVWPTRLIAISEVGRITLDMWDVELNGPIPDSAFKPPRTAVKASTQPATRPAKQPAKQPATQSSR